MEALNKIQYLNRYFSCKGNGTTKNSKLIHSTWNFTEFQELHCSFPMATDFCRQWKRLRRNKLFLKVDVFCLSPRSSALPISDQKKKVKIYLVLKGQISQSKSNTLVLWRLLFQCKYTTFSWAMKSDDDWFKLYKHQSQTVLFILSSLLKEIQKRVHITSTLIL